MGLNTPHKPAGALYRQKEEEMNYTAYNEGRLASMSCDSDTTQVHNPYTAETVEWYSWNRGWNSHYCPIWEVK